MARHTTLTLAGAGSERALNRLDRFPPTQVDGFARASRCRVEVTVVMFAKLVSPGGRRHHLLQLCLPHDWVVELGTGVCDGHVAAREVACSAL